MTEPPMPPGVTEGAEEGAASREEAAVGAGDPVPRTDDPTRSGADGTNPASVDPTAPEGVRQIQESQGG